QHLVEFLSFRHSPRASRILCSSNPAMTVSPMRMVGKEKKGFRFRTCSRIARRSDPRSRSTSTKSKLTLQSFRNFLADLQWLQVLRVYSLTSVSGDMPSYFPYMYVISTRAISENDCLHTIGFTGFVKMFHRRAASGGTCLENT